MNKTEPALKTVVCDVRTFYDVERGGGNVAKRRSYHDHEIIIESLQRYTESSTLRIRTERSAPRVR
jgi:hypothetical protein